jgi:hypothetical protein
MKDFYRGIVALLSFGVILAIGTIVLISKLHDTPAVNDNDYQQAEVQPSMSNNMRNEVLQVSDNHENAISLPDENVIGDTEENEVSAPSENVTSDTKENEVSTTSENIVIDTEENTVSNPDEPAKIKDTVDTSITESSSYLLIGDSRLVGLNQATGIGNDSRYDVKAKNGEGYSWLTKQKLDSSKTIVFMLGVNDLYKVEAYASFYNNLIANGYNIIFVTVAPVDENKERKNGYSVLNEEINNFNNTIKNEVNCTILDLNTYMNLNGFDTADGVHYTAETYELIYDFLTDNLK